MIPMTIPSAVEAAMEIDGWMNEAELTWLATNAFGKKHVVEFGAWKGRSTKVLALARTVWSYDLWDGKIPGHEVAPTVGRDFICNLWEEVLWQRVIPMHYPTHYAAQMNRHDHDLDMVFIDASHEYEDVKRDIDTATTILQHGCIREKRTGLLCGHDFSNDYPGVQQAVRELVPDFQRAPGGDIWFKELKP